MWSTVLEVYNLFSENYWTQLYICYGIALILLLQAVISDPIKHGYGDYECVDWGSCIALIIGLPIGLALIAPLILFVLLGIFVLENEGFFKGYNAYISFQKKFFNKYIDTDYIAIFMPVLCVLTLFLLN